MEYSKMSSVEWDDHVREINRKAKLNGGLVDVSKAVIFRGDIGVMDSSAPKPLSPRENYLASLKLGKGFGVLTDGEFRKENERKVLGGLAPPYSTPENGGVEN